MLPSIRVLGLVGLCLCCSACARYVGSGSGSADKGVSDGRGDGGATDGAIDGSTHDADGATDASDASDAELGADATADTLSSPDVGAPQVVAMAQPPITEDLTDVAWAWTGRYLLVRGGKAMGSGCAGYFDCFRSAGYRYDAWTDSWTKLPADTLTTSRTQTFVWTGREFVFHGGAHAQGWLVNDGYAYSLRDNSYRKLSPTVGDFGVRRGVVWTGREMMYFGMFANDPLSTHAAWDPADNSWWKPPNPPYSRRRAELDGVWTGRYGVYVGGRDENSAVVGDVDVYDRRSNSWTQKDYSALAPRYTNYVTGAQRYLAHTGAEVLVIGGRISVSGDDGRLALADRSWSALPSPPQFFGSSSALAYNGSHAFVSYRNARAMYDPRQDSWSSLPPNSGLASRRWHVTVWTGEHYILCFGQRDDTSAPICERLDPGPFAPQHARVAKQSWRGTPSSAPAGLSEHVSVWTGRELLVWGGRDATNTRVNLGYRYDPAVDTWSPMSTTNAPSPRTQHRAVWIGDRMFVWGGKATTGTAADGGLYDPLTDSWTPVPAASAIRHSHSMVWTGAEVLVWGGVEPNIGDPPGTGARFSPATLAWSPIKRTGAPSRRSSHSAVYTHLGTMIIWGGYDAAGAAVGDGAIYDPATDSWSPLPAAGAPAPRFNAATVYADELMVVWGGRDGQGLRADGAIYDPVAGSWTPIATTGAPAASAGARAVWTGERVIIIGGDDSSNTSSAAVATGAIFDPHANSWVGAITLPAARRAHSAVWTGYVGGPRSSARYPLNVTGDTPRLLVWGGDDGTQTFSTTLLYRDE